ncbi:VRR-NUC domain-containing protein [Neurospora hispaniola]|uniref:Fanconi-associated nuclease n=1 Tax=Neurospora hispaniola TaxID=588809 RepID=A0AAJ0IDJ1_9PEZI|nr:VRR-NUC domain-containing protein [Neurospora hispaniola]
MDRFVKRTRPSHTSNSPLALTAGWTNTNKRPERPPTKKRRTDQIRQKNDAEDDEDDDSSAALNNDQKEDLFLADQNRDSPLRDGKTGSGDAEDGDATETALAAQHHTALEDSLPEVKIDKDIIEEYEKLKSSQVEDGEDSAETRLQTRKWVRGQSSIYVDAFNLALDTVLQDEAHLFEEKENCVLENWRALSYEAQYLYVRLFLRKTASWHRLERLKHYPDISDIEKAIESLLEPRALPEGQSVNNFDEEFVAEPGHVFADTFAFADDSASHIKTVEQAAHLLSLDELKTLAKDAKVQGKNKPDLIKAFCRMCSQQSSLMSVGLRRSSTNTSMHSSDSTSEEANTEKQDTNRKAHFLDKILAITGPLVRLSESVFKLFERVHLVFYRSTEWTEKSLTTIILAKISRRNFPEYVVCRSANIFPSRRYLLEFENSMRLQFEVDTILEFNGPPGAEGNRKVVERFESIAPRWRELLAEAQKMENTGYEFGEGGYLRRFNAGHAYTRIAHKAAEALGRLHRYQDEYDLLAELLSQQLFHLARRGAWYKRKALVEERYMWELEQPPTTAFSEAQKNLQKKRWRQIALATCETALQDPNCHLIYHYDLQKRLIRLEKQLNIPRRQQHNFDHARLRDPEEHTIEGIQLVREDAGRGQGSTKTIWLDELGDPDDKGNLMHVSVEEMCLSFYRTQGWKGYHSEGGILRTLFAYLFCDILFIFVPNVFQTAYQTCPLDLHTDAFYPARASEINHRLVEISNGGAVDLIRRVNEQHRERRTCIVGLNWDYEVEDLIQLVSCFESEALAAICKVIAQDYKARGGGVPDLILWRTTHELSDDRKEQSENGKGEVMFVEVKSANDRLSDTQRLWIHVLSAAGVRVVLCNAVAKEVKTID